LEIEKIYYDVADIYDQKQEDLREEIREKIKDGYNNIPEKLDCCYNCKNFNRNCPKCESEDSSYKDQPVSDVLKVCYYFDRI